VEPNDLKASSRNSRRAAVFGGLASLLSACVPTGLPETVLPPDNTYACRDGTMLRVARAANGGMAVASVGDRSFRLMRVDSPAQEKYTDGASTLYLDGSQALLTSDSFVVAGPCLSTTPLPVAQPWQPR
jgi:membrane-bound inhibitor of C-type lysozyme